MEVGEPDFNHSGRSTCRLVGGFQLVNDSGEFVSLTSRKAAALLAYLLIEPNASVTRERLAGLLWSETPEQAARAALRQCLRRLKTTLDQASPQLLTITRSEVAIDNAKMAADILSVIQDLRIGKVDRAEMLRPQDFEQILHGFDDLDPSYSSWLSVVRKDIRERVLGQLNSLLENTSNDANLRLAAARCLHRLDGAHEVAAGRIIVSEIEKGEPRRCAQSLQGSLGSAR